MSGLVQSTRAHSSTLLQWTSMLTGMPPLSYRALSKSSKEKMCRQLNHWKHCKETFNLSPIYSPEPSIEGIKHRSTVVLFLSNSYHEIPVCLEPFAFPLLPFFFLINLEPHIPHPCFFSFFSAPSHLLFVSHG
jgi:hypothetical protein